MNSDLRPLARRALSEHRYLVAVLVLLLVLNVLGYAFFIYPLSDRVNSVTERTRAAEAELAAARAEHTRAAATVTGTAQAATELDTFYGSVLPASIADARRLVNPRLALMADKAGVQTRNAQASSIAADAEHALSQVTWSVQLLGRYTDIRRFIHDIERAPEFMIIDHIALSQQGEDDRLAVDLDLSTYYRAAKP